MSLGSHKVTLSTKGVILEHKIFDFPTAELLGDFVHGSPQWHEARRNALGGSQIGAALGLNQWESPITCFLKITGQIPSDITPSMSMRLGTKLEAPILEIFAEEHPAGQVFTTGTYCSKTAPWQHANPDGIYVHPTGEMAVVEIKYSSEFWTEPPRSYVAQINWYMHVLGLKQAVIVALCGSSYKEFWFDYNEFEIETMLQDVDRFWDCVLYNERPAWDGSDSTYQSMRELNRGMVEEPIDLGEIGVELLDAQSLFDAAQARLNEMKSKTLDALGEAKYGEVDGVRVCQKQNSSAGLPFLKVKGKK